MLADSVRSLGARVRGLGPEEVLAEARKLVEEYRPRRRRLTLFGPSGSPYLDRWGIEVPHLGGILVHRISGADPGLDLHDHPWEFGSFVLAGSYVEEVDEARATSPTHRTRLRRLWSWERTRLGDRHRIVSAVPGTWTVVLRGPSRQEWGFYVPTASGLAEWVRWDRYDYETRRPGSCASNKTEEEAAVVPVKELAALGDYLEQVVGFRIDPPIGPDGLAVDVEAHEVDGETEAAWCPVCLAMSAVSTEQILARSDTLEVLARFSVVVCTECDYVHPPAADEAEGDPEEGDR